MISNIDFHSLANKGVKRHTMLTMMIDEKKIRHDCTLFLSRKGYGALSALANAAGLSAESVRRVRQGTKVDLDTLVAVKDGMEALKWYEDPQPASPSEAPQNYYADPDPGVDLVLAMKLESMAMELRSPHFSPAHKAEDFLQFVEGLADTLQTNVAAIKKSQKGNT